MHLLNFSRDVSQNYILGGVNLFRADTKIEIKRLLGFIRASLGHHGIEMIISGGNSTST